MSAPPDGARVAAVAIACLASVVVVVAAVVLLLRGASDPAASVDDVAADETSSAEPSAVDTGLSEVRRYSDFPTTHTTEPQDYRQQPPIGGPHDPVWLACGTYDAPVPEENVVHDLEHGTVWITYRPDLPAEEVAALAEVLPSNGILSPYDDLRAPVVITVWEAQLDLTGPDDPRIEAFLDRFGDGETAPEPFASCAGGIRPPSSGASAVAA